MTLTKNNKMKKVTENAKILIAFHNSYKIKRLSIKNIVTNKFKMKGRLRNNTIQSFNYLVTLA